MITQDVHAFLKDLGEPCPSSIAQLQSHLSDQQTSNNKAYEKRTEEEIGTGLKSSMRHKCHGSQSLLRAGRRMCVYALISPFLSFFFFAAFAYNDVNVV